MTESPSEPVVPRVDGMPTLGLGTWKNAEPTQCAETVRTALEIGYRHVDTATLYGNEAAVGEGLAAADVDPDDVFVATKVWYTDLGYDDAIESAEASRDRLGVEVIDLLYVHWPAGAYDAEDTLSAFADLHDDGVIERVGISNFTPELIEEAVAACDVPIFANQVECHPLLPQEAIRATCDAHDVAVVGHTPLARRAILDEPTLSSVAERYDASAAQVCLAWLREKGVTPIPKATGETHLRENLASVDLELDATDVERIDGIDREVRQADPSFASW